MVVVVVAAAVNCSSSLVYRGLVVIVDVAIVVVVDSEHAPEHPWGCIASAGLHSWARSAGETVGRDLPVDDVPSGRRQILLPARRGVAA